LSDNEISDVEFKKIISQIAKKNQTYRKFDEVDLEFDKMFPGKKSESIVQNKLIIFK